MSKHSVATIADAGETGKVYVVLKEIHLDATNDALLVCGGTECPGKLRWVTVVAANTDTQKNTAVLAALRA